MFFFLTNCIDLSDFCKGVTISSYILRLYLTLSLDLPLQVGLFCVCDVSCMVFVAQFKQLFQLYLFNYVNAHVHIILCKAVALECINSVLSGT